MDQRSVMRFQWKMHKLLWNLSGGRIGRRIGGMDNLELITTGRKSGQPRQILIWYLDDGGVPAIVGTNAGKDEDPAWAKNLRDEPRARARWDGRWYEVTAVELVGEDYERVWNQAVATYQGYAEYAEQLTRHIPIFRLETR